MSGLDSIRAAPLAWKCVLRLEKIGLCWGNLVEGFSVRGRPVCCHGICLAYLFLTHLRALFDMFEIRFDLDSEFGSSSFWWAFLFVCF